MNCAHCGQPLPSGSDPRRRTCSTACRVALHRRRKEEREAAFRAAAADLLRRQTEAIQAGADPVVLAEIAREAERLFGDDS